MHEIITEIAAEVSHEPMRVVAEVVQFALLVAIVWIVALGVGHRRGFVRNMLAERGKRVGERLSWAMSAEQGLADAKSSAKRQLREADAEARRIVAAAKLEAASIEETGRAETDAEVARILSRVDEALANEAADMHEELREQLVEIVAQATRSVMNERLSLFEQRELIEKAVLEAVGEPS